MMDGSCWIRDGEEYIHNGKIYTRYEMYMDYVDFIPLTVIATSNNILTDRGMTEIINGEPCLSKINNATKDNPGPDDYVYCHMRIVDKFFMMDYERYWFQRSKGFEYEPLIWA
jgi:hypothetical protein